MERLPTIIANNIIHLRRRNNLTQQDLASKINYSDNAISRWERTEATPTIETLSIIADFFGVRVADLLDENFATKSGHNNSATRVKRIFVMLFSVSIVWTLALIGFIYTMMFKDNLGGFGENGWLLFVLSVPLSALVLYYYNRLWGNKVFHLIIFSIFWWSLLASFYLFILVLSHVNLWLMFLLGIPIQLAQLLWFLLRK